MQGLKKCKFPRKLVEISRELQVEDDRPFMTSQKDFAFLKTLHSRAFCHCIHIDQPGLIQPTSIGSHSTRK